MDTPTYVVKKIGDQYVPVLEEPQPKLSRAMYLGGGALLGWMGLTRRGPLGIAALATGSGLILRGALGHNPLTILSKMADRARSGRPSQTPSYQNDFRNRARQLPSDAVEERSMESFPASDAPG